MLPCPLRLWSMSPTGTGALLLLLLLLQMQLVRHVTGKQFTDALEESLKPRMGWVCFLSPPAHWPVRALPAWDGVGWLNSFLLH